MVKESACHAGDLGSVLGLGRSPGGGHGNPLQYYCLESPPRQRSLADYSPSGHRVRCNWVTKHSPAQSGWIAYIHRICLSKSPLPHPRSTMICWESVSSAQGSRLEVCELLFPCMSPLPLFHDGGHPHFYYWGVSSIFWSCSVTSLWCCCHPWLGSGILIPSQICFDQMLNESSLMTAGFQSLLGISKHVDSFYLHPTSSYRKEQLWTRSREDWHYSASFGAFWGPGHGEEEEGSFSPF